MSDRYTLHAYVCGPSCVVRPDHLGAMTFAQILVERPGSCRYAVVETSGEILVWDLYDAVVHPEPRPPEPVRVMEDVDQAIMATALLYGD